MASTASPATHAPWSIHQARAVCFPACMGRLHRHICMCCRMTSRCYLCATGNASLAGLSVGGSYTTPPLTDEGTFWYTCQVPGHCLGGQVQVLLSSSESSCMPWSEVQDSMQHVLHRIAPNVSLVEFERPERTQPLQLQVIWMLPEHPFACADH